MIGLDLSLLTHRENFRRTLISILWLTILTLSIYLLGSRYEEEITDFIIPFFPSEADKGFTFYLDFVRLCLSELLWLAAFVIITVLLMILFQGRKMESIQLAASREKVTLVIIAAFTLMIFTSYFVLEAFPNSSDEYSYIFQARTIGTGRLWEKAPEPADAFHFNHIAIKDGIRVGRFPPGWPAVLSLAMILGVPGWMVNCLLGFAALIVFYLFAKKFYDERVAFWSTLLLAFSGYFIFNAASYFSHISCLLFALLFAWSVTLFESKRLLHFILAGFFLGAIMLIRYYTAFLLFIPVAAYMVHRFRWRSIYMFTLMGLGAFPCLAALAWYNYVITGDPLTPVTVWAYADEHLGFVKGHTVLKGVEHMIRRTFMFFYWASPGVLLLYFMFLWRKVASRATRWVRPTDYFFIVLLVGHFFYYQIGGNQYGPRFLLEGLPFLILLAVDGTFKSSTDFKWTHALVVSSLLFAVFKLPSIASREERVVHERRDVYDLVNRHQLADAVVLVTSPTGIIRPMPIGDLTRNESPFRSSVIYLQQIPGLDLARLYPKRLIYRYHRNIDSEHGELLQLHHAPASDENVRPASAVTIP